MARSVSDKESVKIAIQPNHDQDREEEKSWAEKDAQVLTRSDGFAIPAGGTVPSQQLCYCLWSPSWGLSLAFTAGMIWLP